MSDLLVRQEPLKSINHHLRDSSAFSNGFFLDRVPQFVIDSDSAKRSNRHLALFLDDFPTSVTNTVVKVHACPIATNGIFIFRVQNNFGCFAGIAYCNNDFNSFKFVTIFSSFSRNEGRTISKSPFSVSRITLIAEHIQIVEKFHCRNIVGFNTAGHTFNFGNSMISSVNSHNLHTTYSWHIKHISHAHCVIIKIFKNQTFCFTCNVVNILANQKVATRFASKLATIICAFISFSANDALDSTRFSQSRLNRKSMNVIPSFQFRMISKKFLICFNYLLSSFSSHVFPPYSEPQLEAVYTDYTSVYTDATLTGGSRV